MAKRRYQEEELYGPAPQQPGFMRTLGGGVLSGLSMAGNLLDVPGSMARDVVGGAATGNWKKYNPVDQLLHPLSETGRVRGRDLNRDLGLAGKRDTYGNWWGGFGTEVALDPLTYIGGLGIAKSVFGKMAGNAGINGLEAARIATAASKAGKLPGLGPTAARAGKASWIDRFIPSGVDWVGPREANQILTGNAIKEFSPEQFKVLESVARNQKGGAYDLVNNMDTPLGSLTKFWPAGDAGLIGTGQVGQKVARGMDVAGDILRHAKIPGTAIRPVGDLTNLVNAKAAKAVNAEDLQAAYHGHHVKEGARYEANLMTAKWANDLKRMGHKDTDVLEVRNWFEFPQVAPPEAQPLVQEVRQYLDRIPNMAMEMGVKIGDLTPKMRAAGSQADYFMRHITEGIVTGRPSAGKMFDPNSLAEMSRAPWTLGSRGGTMALAKMAMDPKVEMRAAKGYKKSLRRYIESKYSNNLPSHYLDNDQIAILNDLGYAHPTLIDAEVEALNNPSLAKKLAPHDTYKAAAESLSSMSPELRKKGIYGNHPVNDFAASAVGTMEKLGATKVALERMVSAAVPAGPGTVPIKNVVKDLGLDAGDGSSYGAAKWLADHGADYENAHIPAETAKFLTQMAGELKGGTDSVHAMVKLYDDIHNFTKIVFTNMDPVRFNVRNVASGQAANVMSGANRVADGAVRDAQKLIGGNPIEGASKNGFIRDEAAKRGIQNLDDARATEILAEMAFAREATGSYGVSAIHHPSAGQTGGKLDDILQGIPGGHPFSWGQVGSKLAGGFGKSGTTLNPFTTYRGVGGADKTRNALAAAGEDISYYAESMNRIAPFWALIQNGVHPDEAIKRVLQAQVGYQSRFYTKFEQQILKRIFLFYSFAKGQIPFTLQQLHDAPGGPLAQALRGINRAKTEDELVPQHVAETAAIPVGNLPFMQPLEKGAKRYVTGLGMGFEDPAQFVGGPQNLGLEALSRMNPLPKQILEGITGQSFFQRAPGGGGRSLEDLDPALGRTLANVGGMTGLRDQNDKSPVRYPGSGFIEHMLSNSPISNLLTKARTITDPRKGNVAKGINLLTGIKATDVSPAAQDKELRGRIGQIEKEMGGQTFTRSYLPKDVQGKLNPKQMQAYLAMQELEKLLGERSKARKSKQ